MVLKLTFTYLSKSRKSYLWLTLLVYTLPITVRVVFLIVV